MFKRFEKLRAISLHFTFERIYVIVKRIRLSFLQTLHTIFPDKDFHIKIYCEAIY